MQNILTSCYVAVIGNLAGWTYDNGAGGVGASLTAPAPGLLTADGLTVPAPARVLVWNETNPAWNGIYAITKNTPSTVAILTRTNDYNTIAQITPGDLVPIDNGTVYGGFTFIQQNTVTVIGIDPITFTAAGPVTYPLPMSAGGTGADLTPSSGSLVFSGNTTLALLPTMANGVLVTDGSGNPSISNTLPPFSISGLTPNEVVVTNGSNVLASMPYAIAATPSTMVLRDSFGDITGELLNGTGLSIAASNTANLGIFNNGGSGGSYLLFSSNGFQTFVGTDGSAFTNIQPGALVLSTSAANNLPIYLTIGESSSWSLKVGSTRGYVSTPNNILDDGSSNMTVSGNLDVGGNGTFNGTTFTFGLGLSGSPATLYIIGSSITGSDKGALEFVKSGTTPTANADALGETSYWGVNSLGSSTRAARIQAVSTANATSSSVQTELAFRFTDPAGAEQIPFILNYQGFTLNGCPTTFSGSSSVNFNFTGPTNVTFPTSGTLATVAGTVSSVVGTANRITVNTVSGTSTVDIASTYVGQSSITTLGTITTGTWNASLIPMAFGGTNANLTATANNLVYSTSTAMALLPTANNGTLVTSNTGVPSISSTLPTAVQNNITNVGTVTSGVWNGTIIDASHGGTGLGAPSPGYMLVGSASAGAWAFLTAPSAEQVLCTDPLGGIIWASSLPTFVQLNITSLGTISAGTWNGSIISPVYGGTGVANASGSTITLGGALTFSGPFTFTGNLTGNTSVTFPTSGTLVTTAVTTLSSLVITESQVTNLTSDLNSKLNLSGGTMTGNLILNADPTVALGAVTKQYADAISAGLDIKQACYAASTAALTVTYNNGTSGVGATLTNAGTQAIFAIDGQTPAVNSRILIKDQSSTFQNGIYTVTNVGSVSTNWVLTRATDYDSTSEIQPGNLIVVDNGTTNGGTGWLQTATVTTIGTSAITFSPFNLMQVGTGLTRSGNTISLSTPVSAANGGTGVSNGTNTITLGGNIVTANSFTTIGNFAVTHTYTGITNVTFPTSGTLVNTAVTTLSSLVITESQVTNLTTDLASKLNLSGGTMTGNLILNANATNALQAVPLQQMTTAANSANFVAATFCGGF